MKQPHTFKQAQTTLQFLLGPIKIKDGLFMGDQLAAKDIQFIISNKVTHVINTVSKAVPNLYERFGIQYLSVHWTEKQENIFDKKNTALNAIFSFVQQAMQAGQSCLIHSLHGKSRACAVLCAYLMKKYNWSLSKCLQFINAKKQGLEIRNNYLAQMQELQKRLLAEAKLSNSWNEVKNEEDLILANTFYNSKKTESSNTSASGKKVSKKKVSWNEKLVQKPPVTTTNNLASTLTKFKDQQPKQSIKLHSILKGDQEQQKINYRQEQEAQQMQLTEDRFISTINGNIVHVTVNNFINTDKKANQDTTPPKMYNTRPFSSDAKDREKKQTPVANTRLFANQGFSNTLKNPYEIKMVSKIGVNRGMKKREEIRNPIVALDRPISANQVSDKKRGRPPAMGMLADKLGGEMMVTGSTAKKRYPSSNPKDDSFKWK